MSPIRVLVIDDSAMVCEILSKGLSEDPSLEVVGSAADAYEAREKIIALRPQVLTLDVQMPRMNGVEFLRKLMPQYPLPVVMVSALTERGGQVTLDALEAGAVDFVTKPTADSGGGLQEMMQELRTKVKIASTANVSHWKHRETTFFPRRVSQAVSISGLERYSHAVKVIAFGASTGGTEALREILQGFPRNMPAIVIVQHMPPGFTQLFATRLNSLCDLEVKEAADGDLVMPGRALVAPGALQLRVVRLGGALKVQVKPDQPVSGHCPSVDVLMRSVAQAVGAAAVGVLLTGMGRDGAEGLKAMRDAGARTLAQDEESSVVFGMPKAAWDLGGAEKLTPLMQIAPAVLRLLDAKT